MLGKIISDSILLWIPIYFAFNFPDGMAMSYLGIVNIIAWVLTVVMVFNLKYLVQIVADRNYRGLHLFYVLASSIVEGILLFQLGFNGLVALYLVTCVTILDYWTRHGKTSRAP